jgi:hypothetical protein
VNKLALMNKFVIAKKFLIAKFDCTMSKLWELILGMYLEYFGGNIEL